MEGARRHQRDGAQGHCGLLVGGGMWKGGEHFFFRDSQQRGMRKL